MCIRDRYEIDMVNGSIMDKLISFALPLMISGILPVSYTHLVFVGLLELWKHIEYHIRDIERDVRDKHCHKAQIHEFYKQKHH